LARAWARLLEPSRHTAPRRNVWLSWKRLLRRVGLPDYKFHELRHTAASLALAEGASLFHVSRLLGHSSISITADTYGHWTDEGREDVARRLENALIGPSAVSSAVKVLPTAAPAAVSEIELTPEGVPGGE
jgi:integrase